MEISKFKLLHREPLTGARRTEGTDGSGTSASTSSLPGLAVHAQRAEPARFLRRNCIRVENGLVALTEPKLASLSSGRIEVDIAAEGPAYPGIAFRIADNLNYELMYSQPHSSGQWDALQYDPVFHGSNTWQIYHGPKFQKEAVIPTGEWYTLVVEFRGKTGSIHLPGEEPLTVEGLAMPQTDGAVGIWTYLPAYFRDLRAYAIEPANTGPRLEEADTNGKVLSQSLPPGLITAWLAEGYGVVECESHGILNLNRYFPLSPGEVILTRRFCLEAERKVVMSFGLSDDLTLSVDGLPIYTSTKPYRPTAGIEGRGYIGFDTCKMSRTISAGTHTLSVKLKVTEPFGWGLALSLTGEGLRLLPAGL